METPGQRAGASDGSGLEVKVNFLRVREELKIGALMIRIGFPLKGSIRVTIRDL